MNTLVLDAAFANDSVQSQSLVLQRTDAPAVTDAAPEAVLLVAVALATGVAIHLASRALSAIAQFLKAIAAAGVASLLMVAVLIIALVYLLSRI